MIEIIWQTTLDGKYECSVERTTRYRFGDLIIRDGDKELLREEVYLSYGAKFGPDVGDVAEWQERCVAFVDGEAA